MCTLIFFLNSKSIKIKQKFIFEICCNQSNKYVVVSARKKKRKSNEHNKDKKAKPTKESNNTYKLCSFIRQKAIKIV